MTIHASRRRAPVSRRTILKAAGAGTALIAFPTVLTPRKTRAATRIVARDSGGP